MGTIIHRFDGHRERLNKQGLLIPCLCHCSSVTTSHGLQATTNEVLLSNAVGLSDIRCSRSMIGKEMECTQRIWYHIFMHNLIYDAGCCKKD